MVFGGLFSLMSIQGVMSKVCAALTPKFKTCVGKAGLAGCEIVMVAGVFKVANRKTTGRSP